MVFSYSLHGSAVLIGFYGVRPLLVFGLHLSIWNVWLWEAKQSRVVMAGELIGTNKARKGIVKKS